MIMTKVITRIFFLTIALFNLSAWGQDLGAVGANQLSVIENMGPFAPYQSAPFESLASIGGKIITIDTKNIDACAQMQNALHHWAQSGQESEGLCSSGQGERYISLIAIDEAYRNYGSFDRYGQDSFALNSDFVGNGKIVGTLWLVPEDLEITLHELPESIEFGQILIAHHPRATPQSIIQGQGIQTSSFFWESKKISHHSLVVANSTLTELSPKEIVPLLIKEILQRNRNIKFKPRANRYQGPGPQATYLLDDQAPQKRAQSPKRVVGLSIFSNTLVNFHQLDELRDGSVYQVFKHKGLLQLNFRAKF